MSFSCCFSRHSFLTRTSGRGIDWPNAFAPLGSTVSRPVMSCLPFVVYWTFRAESSARKAIGEVVGPASGMPGSRHADLRRWPILRLFPKSGLGGRNVLLLAVLFPLHAREGNA